MKRMVLFIKASKTVDKPCKPTFVYALISCDNIHSVLHIRASTRAVSEKVRWYGIAKSTMV